MKTVRLPLLALLVLAGCSHPATQAAAIDARPVKVAPAEAISLRRDVDLVGTLAAQEDVVVSAEVAGRVSRVLKDLGDRVPEGTPLVELDRERLQYRVDTQRATLEEARARYGASGNGPLPALDRVPTVVSTAAQLADAQQQLDRAQSLASRKLLAQSDLDAAQTKYDTAKAAHDAALASARQLRGDIEAQTSALNLAERDLRDALIRAPFDGYVAQRFVSPGQYLQPQAAVMRIVRLHPLKLTADVPEKFAPWLQTGRPIQIRVDAFPGQTFTGRIVRISPAVDLKSRAFAIEGEVPNPDGTLKPGTFARVQIATDRVDRAVMVPETAVQSRYGTNRVFEVQKGQLVGREIVLGDRLGDKVEVAQGLPAGAPIVAADVEQLADGMKVTVK